ncbi:pyridoxamine 5'-phosphate oxidase family protein [Nocardioides sp. AX2bis]|uniref:pyridoxamine 5'-phosphate oxidase family protein n=1 Tax=Nocardioides sp. AX2bis TaxID=2653157 RepID=UPI0012F37030|nr:pyridoxamine 5'-phosphate oxidase family protein [Nocardioides sp. AX2bis]VXC54197.1 conserved hypothetical protein [Nocardioides sp. AX2bis]
MATRGLGTSAALEELDAGTCRTLLGSRSFGRICLVVEDRVVVVVTTYVLQGSELRFRAAAFGPAVRGARERPVTFQVDDAEDGGPPTWSVTVSGIPQRVQEAAVLASLWSAPRTQPWEAGLTSQWLTLVTDDVRGRRVPRRA